MGELGNARGFGGLESEDFAAGKEVVGDHIVIVAGERIELSTSGL